MRDSGISWPQRGVAVGASWGDRRLRFRHFRGYRRICRADGFFPEGATREEARRTYVSVYFRASFLGALIGAGEPTHRPLGMRTF